MGSIRLSASPDLAQIEYPEELFSLEQGQDDEAGWEAACQWLDDRRRLNDLNQFEIGWMANRVVTRYGEGSRAKWARAGGFSPGTIGRYWWVASRWNVDEVRQVGGIAPGFSFKHFEYLTDYKAKHDWEETMDWVEQAHDMGWSAETMRARMRGEDENESPHGKPMLVNGVLSFQEVWVADEETGQDVKKAAVMIIMDGDAVEAVINKATERGFISEFVEALIRFPKGE